LIIIILLSIYIYTINSENLHKYLENLEIANSNLLSAREALKISEYKFKTIFNNISDDVFVTDMDANIIEINDVACNNLGYTKDEFLSMKIDDIKSEKYKKYIKKNREEIISKGKLNYESEHKTKEGKIISVEIKSKLADLENYKYIISIARNLTQRKEFEKKILSAVIQTEEKERERFSKEMHDGIGPLLSTIKLYVNELCSPDIDHEERKQMVEYTNELIDETISNIRTISNNLTPRIIKDYGLMKAIDAFSKKVNKTNKININYTYKGIDDKVNFEVQLILFRVVTELINNTIKHANAKNIDIFLVRNDNNIFLSYTDDGIGFNIKETINNKETGMGLKNIISRVKSINGTCIFKSEKNKGFKLSIDITI
ncbi:MAG: PAS domain S-box protein, partial [Bacteroidales bacterium]|nr:PAS domain S-box protein [Bacteroidales bacterium]